jgi:hypothetical protein
MSEIKDGGPAFSIGEHVACAEGGILRWMTGRKFENCELYTSPEYVKQVAERLAAALSRLIAATDAYSTMHAPDEDDVARMLEYAAALDNARSVLAETGAK